MKFSDRPAVRAGADEVWDRAEAALKEACAIAGVDYTLNPGEGAFYGPKLEFVLRDAIGRDWQCGTLQVDFVLPERLDAEYVGEDGARHRPVMLHRAILGSFERFLGILIEQYAGRFPLWLAPVQVVVATIVSDADDYAGEVAAALRAAGLAVEIDLTNQKINAKVREHSLPARAGDRGGRPQGGGGAHGGAAPARRRGAGGAAAGRGGGAACAEATPPDLSRVRPPGLTCAAWLDCAPDVERKLHPDRSRASAGRAAPIVTATGDDHSQRTHARPANPRRAPRERGDPRRRRFG